MPREHRLTRIGLLACRAAIIQSFIVLPLAVLIASPLVIAAPVEQMVPVLSHVWEANAKGSVDYVHITFDRRADAAGLAIHFKTTPGRFSRSAKTSIEEAIRYTARALNLSPDSWTVVFSVPYPDITISGESLSGMVGLSVAAMATGRTIDSGLLLTGLITPEGHIGPVGTAPLRIPAPGRARLRRVLVSREQIVAERDQPARDLMPITPIATVTHAFQELTGNPSKP